MKKFSLVLIGVLSMNLLAAQTVTEKLKQAIKVMESDNQFRHAIIGFYVIDALSGKTVYALNEQKGFAPASTLKVVTAAAAYELLGKDFTYTTSLYAAQPDASGMVSGDLWLQVSGDPTLGSWRWPSTSEKQVYSDWSAVLESKGIRGFAENASIRIVAPGFGSQAFPDGWIWQDIGNYYGARHAALNWRENQFDIHFTPGRAVKDPVLVSRLNPVYTGITINPAELRTGPAGSGDQAYVYLDPEADNSMLVAGTVPLAEPGFSISAAHPKPLRFFSEYLQHSGKSGFRFPAVMGAATLSSGPAANSELLYTHQSPPLDTIVWWFLRKSINLYGEALLKSISLQTTDEQKEGVAVVKDLFGKAGIAEAALNIVDGSGLSPQNRITPAALVGVLKYARSRPWYASFYHAMPLINGMKMKSGSINGARAYAGYHKSGSGQEYIYAIVVNNYSGSASMVTRKLFTVLNALK